MPTGVQKQFHTKLRYLANCVLASGIKSWSGIGPDGKELSSGGFRLVLTTEFDNAIDVLHAFKKDSGRGRKTRGRHSELVVQRYAELCVQYGARSSRQ
jgi:phage-related protein